MTDADGAHGLIRWAQGGADTARHTFACRACGVNAAQIHVLDTDNPNPNQPRLSLYRCEHCESLNFSDFEVVPEIPWEQLDDKHREHCRACTKFYVEQGVGLDLLVRMLFSLPPPPAGRREGAKRRFLEVGCGYGITLDFARNVFGWEAMGVDPMPMSHLGSEQLGVNIIPDYIAPGFQLPGGPCDILFCVEVIEHIKEPEKFLASVSNLIADDGCLLLTTPDAAGCTPQQTVSALLPMLSPSCHTLLFSRRGLHELLQRVGFTHIQMQERENRLCALASRCPLPAADFDSRLDRKLYRRYLRERSRTLPDGEPLRHGLLYRLFKELTYNSLYEDALHVFAEIADGYQRRYGMNLADPDSVVLQLIKASRNKFADSMKDFTEFVLAVPVNLCGILYCRGMIAFIHENNYLCAYNYLHNAELAGRSLQDFFIGHSMSDGEIGSLIPLSQKHKTLARGRIIKLMARLRIIKPLVRLRHFFRKHW